MATPTFPRHTPAPGAAARLVLTEALIGCRDLETCAQIATDWIASELGTKKAICVLAEEGERPRLVAASAVGVDPARLSAFAVDLEDTGHPIVRLLGSARETIVHPTKGDPLSAVLGTNPWMALALPPQQEEPVAGALLLPMPVPRPRDALWVAQLLGRRLLDVRHLRDLALREQRESRERALLERVLTAVPDLVLFTDVEGRVLLANPRAERYFASQEEESEGRRRAVALNNMLFSAGLSRRAIEGPTGPRRELPLVDPDDGSDRLFELMSAVTSGSEGPGIVSILRNVGDLQRAAQESDENYRKLREAEVAVRAERDRLDLVIDSVADPILVTDSNGRLVMMNRHAERLFTPAQGMKMDELQRVRANDAHFSSHVANLFLAPAGQKWRGDVGLVDPWSGASAPFEAVSGAITSPAGDVTGVVTILHDRTEALEKARLYEQLKEVSSELEKRVRDATKELVRQNELLRRQAIEVEQASQLKTQFLATMSHEFRTPLNAILGYTQILLKGVSGGLTAGQKRNLERVDSNAKHLLAIINDILDISRIEAGKMPIKRVRFSVEELLAEVVAEVEPLVDRKKVHLKATCAARMPLFDSDRSKVKQVLMNLVSNAIKFTPRGSVDVTACLDGGKKELRVSVADTGIGIAKEDQARIFDDFRQLDETTTRPYGGAGLGLSICKRLAGILDGKISLVSRVGRGSTFTLTLPARTRKSW